LNKARTLIVDEAKKVKSAAQAGFSKYSSESSSEEQNQPVMEQGEVNKN